MKRHITLIALISVAFLSSCGQRSKFNPKDEPLVDSYQLPQELQYKPEVENIEDIDIKTKKPARGKADKKMSTQ